MHDYKQQVINFFDRRTAYDAEGDSHPQEAKRLLEYVRLKSGRAVLDMATGTGLVAIAAAKKVAPNGSVTGVDMSLGMLKQAKSKIAAEGIDNLKLIEADVEAMQRGLGGLPHERLHQEAIAFDVEFDVIFCCSALVYISDLTTMLNKCYSWLKPGGCFAFTTPDKKSYLAQVKVRVCQDLFGIDLPHIIRPLWTPTKCRNLLQQSGFKNIAIEKHLYSRTKIGDNYSFTRLEREFYPRGNPLSNLSEAQKELLQVEYTKAVTQLIAGRGVWQEANNLYVKAYK